MNTPPPTFILGSGLADIPTDVAGICLVISREEVMNPRVGRCVDDLMHLSGSRERTEQFAGAVLFVFEGWDHDPREIHAIPECRAFLSALTAQWPYWMHFLAPIPDLWAVMLLSLIPPSKPVPLPGGRIGRAFDAPALRALLTNQTNAMNNLHQLHGLDLPTRQRIFQQAMQVIDAATTDHPNA